MLSYFWLMLLSDQLQFWLFHLIEEIGSVYLLVFSCLPTLSVAISSCFQIKKNKQKKTDLNYSEHKVAKICEFNFSFESQTSSNQGGIIKLVLSLKWKFAVENILCKVNVFTVKWKQLILVKCSVYMCVCVRDNDI